jgi:broad specificity phosphatase PhoE
MGNDDETLFTKIPDWKIPLSHQGREQAREAGKRIQKIIGSSRVVFYVSPYRRTIQTLQEIKSSIPAKNVLFTREEPRLREQDFGNFQDFKLIQNAKKERDSFGRFFYRFPHGESGADVFDRVSAFCGTFHRDLAQIEDGDATAVFVTHGITARLFVMRWLHWSVEDFEALHNPPNCGLLHLQRVGEGANTAYRLTEESRELIQAPTEKGIGRGLQLGHMLSRKNSEKDIRTWDELPETAWGI